MKVQKVANIKEIKIFHRNYRVQEVSGDDNADSYFSKITNSWMAKQQGLAGKEKKKPKVIQREEQKDAHYEKERVYYEKKE